MHLSGILSFTGAATLLVALLLHIVCLAIPNYSSADFTQIHDDMKGKDLTPEEKQELQQISDADIKIHYGLWKLCLTSKYQLDGKKCLEWTDELTPGDWVKGGQAMALLASILLGLGTLMAGVNVLVDSRGDRLRVFPSIIAGFAFAGALTSLCGNFVLAAKYKSLQDLPNQEPMSAAVKAVIGDAFTLSFGFILDIMAGALACGAGLLHLFARYVGQTVGPV